MEARRFGGSEARRLGRRARRAGRNRESEAWRLRGQQVCMCLRLLVAPWLLSGVPWEDTPTVWLTQGCQRRPRRPQSFSGAPLARQTVVVFRVCFGAGPKKHPKEHPRVSQEHPDRAHEPQGTQQCPKRFTRAPGTPRSTPKSAPRSPQSGPRAHQETHQVSVALTACKSRARPFRTGPKKHSKEHPKSTPIRPKNPKAPNNAPRGSLGTLKATKR